MRHGRKVYQPISHCCYSYGFWIMLFDDYSNSGNNLLVFRESLVVWRLYYLLVIGSINSPILGDQFKLRYQLDFPVLTVHVCSSFHFEPTGFKQWVFIIVFTSPNQFLVRVTQQLMKPFRLLCRFLFRKRVNFVIAWSYWHIPTFREVLPLFKLLTIDNG